MLEGFSGELDVEVLLSGKGYSKRVLLSEKGVPTIIEDGELSVKSARLVRMGIDRGGVLGGSAGVLS